MKKMYCLKVFLPALLLLVSANFIICCKPAEIGPKPSNSQYYNRTNQVDAVYINDIQYRSAYKYDNNGKKYKKHYRKKKKDKN